MNECPLPKKGARGQKKDMRASQAWFIDAGKSGDFQLMQTWYVAMKLANSWRSWWKTVQERIIEVAVAVQVCVLEKFCQRFHG